MLGCLIEKWITTPDQYPLTLNALRLACNQSTNREPVVSFDEATVRDAAQRLTRFGLARLASGHSSRAIKYRHLAEDALELERPQLALLALLLLRGEQTPGELKARAARMAPFGSLSAVDAALALLCERGYAERVGRRPGQKEDRFRQLLGARGGPDAAAVGPEVGAVRLPGATAVNTPEMAAVGTRTVEGQEDAMVVAPGPDARSPQAPPRAGGRDLAVDGTAGLEARLEALERKVERLAAALESLR